VIRWEMVTLLAASNAAGYAFGMHKARGWQMYAGAVLNAAVVAGLIWLSW
jgi:hypothetical protein